MKERYRNQVRLLLQVLPVLSVTETFALKGGTAINFFFRNFPFEDGQQKAQNSHKKIRTGITLTWIRLLCQKYIGGYSFIFVT